MSFTIINENIKRRAYGQRIREVEHASFIPIIMSATGGWLMKPQFSTSVWLPSYRLSGVMNTLVLGWLRCCLGFSLLHSAIQCIRGARSSIGAYTRAPPPMDLVQVDSRLSE